jgi:outer membrane protein OmpA-like peptidoglycan-associated protein
MSKNNLLGPRSLGCVAGLMALLALACSREPPTTAHFNLPPAGMLGPTPAPKSGADSFIISEGLRKKCSLPQTAENSPQFDFDEATLRPRGEGILDSIATCVTTGSLKGEGVTITGHTDPRGSTEYNLSLGMQRANAARDYLAGKGVASSEMTVTSRGEQDAAGQTESEFQLDRRVEIGETEASR